MRGTRAADRRARPGLGHRRDGHLGDRNVGHGGTPRWLDALEDRVQERRDSFLHVDDQLARCASRGSRARGRACDHARAGRLRRRSGGKARCVMQTLAAQQRPFGPAGRGVILEDILRWPGAASRARSLVNSGSGRQMRPEWTRSTADVGNAVTGKVSPLRPASLYPRRQLARLMLTEGRVGDRFEARLSQPLSAQASLRSQQARCHEDL